MNKDLPARQWLHRPWPGAKRYAAQQAELMAALEAQHWSERRGRPSAAASSSQNSVHFLHRFAEEAYPVAHE
jgi:hypothetical protein